MITLYRAVLAFQLNLLRHGKPVELAISVEQQEQQRGGGGGSTEESA